MIKKNKNSIIIVFIISLILVFLDYKIVLGDDKKQEEKSVYTLQIEERAELLRKTLDKFGATSKEQAINLYAKGVKSRSGPMQYSVMCSKLKKEFVNKMQEEENYAWVTGVSSPWIKDYKIMKVKKVNGNEYQVTIVFFLETSSGPFETSKTMITISNKNNIWCITDINEDIK